MDMSTSDGVAPIIGIPASTTTLDIVPVHMASTRYIESVALGCGGLPFIIPALGAQYDLATLLAAIDGLLLTGGRANIEPHHYQKEAHPPGDIRDAARDATVLPLIRAAIDAGVPVFGVCRGFQEINVALGGTLHYRVHEIDGMLDHRMDPNGTIEEKFALKHHIDMPPEGELARLLGATRVTVNSLHGQGIDRPGAGLAIEARAPDGLIEALRVTNAQSFALGVQWHAEWQFDSDPVSRVLFAEFAGAARARARRRHARTGALA